MKAKHFYSEELPLALGIEWQCAWEPLNSTLNSSRGISTLCWGPEKSLELKMYEGEGFQFSFLGFYLPGSAKSSFCGAMCV